MNKKFLPIGTICTLKEKEKKVMITGYYSVKFNEDIKFNDYMGCVYPEGLLLPQSACSFNHSDIEKVDFIGYENEEYNKFNVLLKQLTGTTDEYEKEDWVLSSSDSYSKLLFDENGVVVLAEPTAQEKVDNAISLDENPKLENPFHKEYTPVSPIEEMSNNIFGKYNFDENGVVLSENFDLEEKKENELNKIEFDENGEIVSNASPLLETQKIVQYKFDADGFLVAIESSDQESMETLNQEQGNKEESFDFDSEVKTSPNPEKIEGVSEIENEIDKKSSFDQINEKTELNELKNEMTQYKFDENGILISA